MMNTSPANLLGDYMSDEVDKLRAEVEWLSPALDAAIYEAGQLRAELRRVSEEKAELEKVLAALHQGTTKGGSPSPAEDEAPTSGGREEDFLRSASEDKA